MMVEVDTIDSSVHKQKKNIQGTFQEKRESDRN